MWIEDNLKHFLQDVGRGLERWKRRKGVLLHGNRDLAVNPGAGEKSKAAEDSRTPKPRGRSGM
jgi:hypothetical protein